MTTTVSGLESEQTYTVTLTGEQIESARRCLISDHTFRNVMLRQQEFHPDVERGMRHEQALLMAILDVLPVGEVVLCLHDDPHPELCQRCAAERRRSA